MSEGIWWVWGLGSFHKHVVIIHLENFRDLEKCVCVFSVPRKHLEKINPGFLLLLHKNNKLSVSVSNYIWVATGIMWKYWLNSQAPWMCETHLVTAPECLSRSSWGQQSGWKWEWGNFLKVHLYYKELLHRFYMRGQLKHQIFLKIFIVYFTNYWENTCSLDQRLCTCLIYILTHKRGRKYFLEIGAECVKQCHTTCHPLALLQITAICFYQQVLMSLQGGGVGRKLLSQINNLSG